MLRIHPGLGRWLVAAIITRRRILFVAWVAAAAALIPFANGIESKLQSATRIEGGEAARVADLLLDRFDSPFAHNAILVVEGLAPATTPEGKSALARIISAVRDVDGVIATASYLDAADGFFAGEDASFAIVGLDPHGPSQDVLIARLRAAGQTFSGAHRSEFPSLALLWTGETALNADLRDVGTAEARRAEFRIVPITLAFLFLAFGALIAAGLPVLSGVLVLPLALGAAALVAGAMPVSVLLVNVVTMIGLGLSIDYALLIVSRFRELLAAGNDGRAAATGALRYAGATVATSGLAVGVGFAGLLVVPIAELRSMALGGLLAVIASVLVATTLLPGVLAELGARVDFGRLRLFRRRLFDEGWWRRWGEMVAARPKTVFVLAALPLIALGSQTARLSISLPQGDWLPKASEAVRGAETLARFGHAGLINAIPVVVELPPGIELRADPGWQALDTVSRALRADPRVERVRSIAAPTGGTDYGRTALDLAPEAVRRSFVSRDGAAFLLEIIPRSLDDQQGVTELVRELRARDPAALSGLAGTRLLFGGLPAFNAEYQDVVAFYIPIVVLLVALGTFVILALRYRCLLVPLKAVLLNFLSVGATFGALVLVFQDGHGGSVFGLEGALGGVYPFVPILVFCTIFGLSIDYEVFLVSRLAELRKAGLADREALVEALALTGRVITNAGVIMVVVFGAFMLSDFLLIRILGFALALAVLIDATVVRLAVGPALFRLAGRWNWWPGG